MYRGIQFLLSKKENIFNEAETTLVVNFESLLNLSREVSHRIVPFKLCFTLIGIELGTSH